MKPHKHADLIKAWADGAEIQYKFKEATVWQYHPCPYWDNPAMEFRIAPEPKPDIVEYMYVENVNRRFFVSKGKENLPNLKLTFDGETSELKSAEVLR